MFCRKLQGKLMHPKLNVAVKAALNAGRLIIAASENLTNITIKTKSHNNYVTNIDLKVEQEVIKSIEKAFKNQYFITEESGKFGDKKSNYTWIIDPIDGTNNFIHGLPNCCIAIAMQFKGITEIGLVYNPISNQLFTAVKGSGSQLNGKRIRVSTQKIFMGCLLSGSIKYSEDFFKDNYPKAVLELSKYILGIRYSGSLALDMCYVAAGILNGLWTSRNANIWDIAAGELIIREAGGIVSSFNNDQNILKHGIFASGNPRIVKKILNFFDPYIF